MTEALKAADHEAPQPAGYKDRLPRRTAHIPVQLRKWRWLPWLSADCHLLDLSEGGAKLQSGHDLRAAAGSVAWMVIDTGAGPERAETDAATETPAALAAGTTIAVKVECRWYNAETRMLGVAFVGMSDETREAVRRAMADFKAAGRLEC